MLKRLGLALAACALSTGALAASVTPVTSAAPSDIVGTLNTIIGTLNGTQCTATGTTPQTCNGTRGIVTTGTLTTAASTNAAFVINNSFVGANAVVQCTGMGYSGTITTNGWPVILNCVPNSAGTITVNITNANGTNALNGAVTIAFALEQN